MLRNFVFVFSLLLIVIIIPVQSQQHVHDHGHSPNDHTHGGSELGLAVGLVPILEEGVITFGTHLHYIRGISANGKFGMGLAFETIFDEHLHLTLSLANQFRPYKGIFLGYAPGILFLREEGLWSRHFAQHAEIGYEFEIMGLHIGPIADVAFANSDFHFLIGIHFGISL